MKRREFVAAMPFVVSFVNIKGCKTVNGDKDMFGLIGKMITAERKRDEFIKILLEGTDAMPGCLSYIIAKDTTEPNTIWVTEVWKDEASHKASLTLPAVKAAIAKGRPMIAGFGDQTITEPVGGVGLKKG